MKEKKELKIGRLVTLLLSSLVVITLFTMSAAASGTYFIETFDTDPPLADTQTPDTWYVDRYAPAGFESAFFDGDNRLKVSIDDADYMPYGSTFYNYQGRKYDLNNPIGSCLTADLYIGSDWETNNRHASLWATTFDASDSISGYPIFGFTNGSGFKIYSQDVDQDGIDTDGDGNLEYGWYTVGFPTGFSYGEWYTLKLTLTADAYEYYINDDLVWSDGMTFNSTYFGNIMLQAYNYNEDYEIYWDNVGAIGPVKNLDSTETFDTIQAAINDDDTLNGHTIEVSDGIYPENIVIDKQLTLQAGSSPIIDGSGGVCVVISSSDVTIDGFEIRNGSQGILGWLGSPVNGDGYQNIKLLNNHIHKMSNSVHGFGIYLGTESERYNPSDPLGIYDSSLTSLMDFTGLEIKGNEINDTSGACITVQSMYSTGPPLLIENNYIHNGTQSAVWVDSVEDLDILSNLFENCATGVFLSAYSDGYYEGTPNQMYDPKDISIMFNDMITNNNGVSVYDAFPALLHISENNFVGNSGNGVYNYLSEDVTATCNWWADITGPSDQGSGTGDAVSTNVVFCPWLDAAYPAGDCIGGAVCRNVEDDIYFCSIQKAIDADTTNDGETIEVFAGTHPGNLLVYKEVTIESKDGAASTIIDANVVDYSSYENEYGNSINYAWSETNDPGLLKNGFMIWNDSVTIDGFTIINAQWPSQYNRGIGILIGSISTTYAGFIPWNLDQWNGIVPDPDEPTPTGVVIKNNIIDAPSDGVYNWASSGNTIEYNTITNTVPVGGVGIQVYGGGTDNVIRGNLIDNAGDAISIGGAWPDVLLDVSNTEIYGNTLSNSIVGIKFYNVDGSGVEAYDNDILNNGKGLVFDSVGSASVAIAYCNNITGNSVGAENNANTDTFIAHCNWWGDASGPSGQGAGTGDAVGLNVNFDPWVGQVVADISGPNALYVGLEYSFDASGSSLACGCGLDSIVSYDWDFGDGNTGSGVNPSHVYDTAGTYTVTLTVTTSLGGSDTISMTVTVRPSGDEDDIPLIQLYAPENDANVNGVVTVKWFAIDDDCPDGQGLSIRLYYKNGGWRLISDDLFNNVDGEHGSFDWDTSGFADGSYELKVQVMDPEGNVGSDDVTVHIGNGNSGVMISDVLVVDASVGSNDFVKDGDMVVVSAGLTGSVSEVDGVFADLSGFGLGSMVPADSFDGFTATWTIENVVCDPSDGEIEVTVFAGDAEARGVIVADNTVPEVSLETPLGLYLFNNRVFPLNSLIAIGGVDIDVSAVDGGCVDRVEYYVDGSLVGVVDEAPFGWHCDLKSFGGRHRLEAVVFDGAGNQNVVSQEMVLFSLFGQDW